MQPHAAQSAHERNQEAEVTCAERWVSGDGRARSNLHVAGCAATDLKAAEPALRNMIPGTTGG